jgi:low temperature requirement protein LtrA
VTARGTPHDLVRHTPGAARVTNVELFFDLVYVFALVALWDGPLRPNFQRILAWCIVSGALAVAGGIVAGPARGWLWLAAVGVDLLGGVAGHPSPSVADAQG